MTQIFIITQKDHILHIFSTLQPALDKLNKLANITDDVNELRIKKYLAEFEGCSPGEYYECKDEFYIYNENTDRIMKCENIQ